MKKLTSPRVLGGIFMLSAALSLSLALDGFGLVDIWIRESVRQNLIAIFPSLGAALSNGSLRPNQAFIFAIQWILVPIEAAFLLLVVLNRGPSKSPKSEAPVISEWVGMAVVWCISAVWILGSFSIVKFPTFINGELLFSNYSSKLIISILNHTVGISSIAWLSAWCESAMAFFFFILPIAYYRYYRRSI